MEYRTVSLAVALRTAALGALLWISHLGLPSPCVRGMFST